MYMRVVKGQTQPGKVEELAQRWRDIVGPQLAAMPGFRHAHFGGDRAGNVVLAVSLWDGEPGEATPGRNLEAFRARVQDVSTGPPTVETYEILAEA